MVRSISNIINALILGSVITLVLTSCQKSGSIPGNSSSANELTGSATQKEDIPGILDVPEGSKLVEDAFAVGVQIYQVQRNPLDPGVFQWVNIAPRATLFSNTDQKKIVAFHFAGPSWQLTTGPDRGEIVVARRSQGITVDNSAIQWLLLTAVDSLSSAGNKIKFIQRVFTKGGLAPELIPDESLLGQIDSVPYTARYLLYEAKK
ncbi:MAG TPA: DUF3455 domain-containing protein [Chitinophagaceae bacterium]